MCNELVGPARLLFFAMPSRSNKNYGDCYVLGCFQSKKKRRGEIDAECV